jgi:hypothetical protein
MAERGWRTVDHTGGHLPHGGHLCSLHEHVLTLQQLPAHLAEGIPKTFEFVSASDLHRLSEGPLGDFPGALL